MKSLYIVIIFILVSCKSNYYGAEDVSISKRIGCSNMTNIQKKNPDFFVANYEELVFSLSQIKEGGIIRINDTAKINLTGKSKIEIKQGVSLVSGNTCENQGALLYTSDIGHSPAIECTGNGVKLIGIRLIGPDSSRRVKQMYNLISMNKYYELPNSIGIRCVGFSGLIIQNCELMGWSFSAIDIERGEDNIIRNNYIHHNQRLGLGYGVMLHDAYALIEENFFNWNRHSVAGSGRLNTGYEIRNNIFGKRSLNYVLDMHGIYDERVNDTIGGRDLNIHHNTFYTIEDGPIVLHGDPINTARIHHNIFLGNLTSEKAYVKGVFFRNGKVRSYKNIFKSDFIHMKTRTVLLKTHPITKINKKIKLINPKFSLE